MHNKSKWKIDFYFNANIVYNLPLCKTFIVYHCDGLDGKKNINYFNPVKPDTSKKRNTILELRYLLNL